MRDIQKVHSPIMKEQRYKKSRTIACMRLLKSSKNSFQIFLLVLRTSLKKATGNPPKACLHAREKITGSEPGATLSQKWLLVHADFV